VIRFRADASTGVAEESGAGRRLLTLVTSPAALAGLVVVMGAGLRFYRLDGRSFWLDEVFTSDASRLTSLSQVVEWCRTVQQGLLYFGTAWIVARLGDSEVVLRAPSALAGVLTIVYGYKLGRTLYSPAVGLLSALLLATMFFPVWYSQEARPYAFMMLLVTAQTLYAYRSYQLSRARDWLALAVTTVLSLYNHYMALLPTLACGLFIAFALVFEAGAAWRARDRSAARRVLVKAIAAVDTALLVFLGWMPWIRTFIAFIHGESGYFFLLVPSHRFQLQDAVSLLQNFGFQGVLLVLLVAGFGAALLRGRRGGGAAAGLLLLLVAVPLSVLVAKLGGGALLIWSRYLAFLVPIGAVLTALGAEEVALAASRAYRHVRRPAPGRASDPAARLAVLVMAAAVSAQSLSILIPSYSYQKDDYRDAVNYVLAHGSSRDVIIPVGDNSIWLAEALPYYARRTHSHLLVAYGEWLARFVDLPSRLRDPHVQIWAAVVSGDDPNGIRAQHMIANMSSTTDLRTFPNPDLEVTHYLGVSVVRVRQSGLTPVDQMTILLRWAASFEPNLRAQLNAILATQSRLPGGRAPPPRR
jgi:hypothetical protein